MSITYEWVVKHLSANNRGYANIGVFEMQGTDELSRYAKGSVTVVFGDSELKPLAQWTQENIDAYAETKRADIEQAIITALESGADT